MVTLIGTDGLTYTYENYVLTITGAGAIGSMDNRKIYVQGGTTNTDIIPEMKSLVVAEGITGVNREAFRDAPYLESVSLPSTFGNMHRTLFYQDIRLKTVRIPASVASMGDKIFTYSGIETIIFEGSQPTMIANTLFIGRDGVKIYSPGWANDTTITSSISGGSTFVYYTGVPTDYAYIKVNSKKVKVDMAVRDEDGLRIKTKYAKKTELFSGSYNDLSNKPTIPDELADLSADSTHRVVTDTQISTWNGKQDALSFDNVPTENSNNPVKSGGIYSAIATAISSVLRYKGSVSTLADLPTTGRTAGDVYNVATAGTATLDDVTITVNAGDNVAFNGTSWDVLAGIVDLSGKLDKVTTSGPSRAYTVDNNGAQAMVGIYSGSATAWSIAQRGTGGVVKVGTPSDNADATTKEYVDGKIVSTWQNTTDDEHAPSEKFVYGMLNNSFLKYTGSVERCITGQFYNAAYKRIDGSPKFSKKINPGPSGHITMVDSYPAAATGEITLDVTGLQATNLKFTNTAVSTWASDNTYPEYPYKASVALTGVTADDTAEVIFGVAEATSGDYAPVCETYAGGVYIYSAVNDSITIPTIIIFKG